MGILEYSAVMASNDSTERIAIVLPYARLSPWTPTDTDDAEASDGERKKRELEREDANARREERDKQA